MTLRTNQDVASAVISGREPGWSASKEKPKEVELRELLTNGGKFQGQKVLVHGFYRWRLDGSRLGVDKQAVLGLDNKASIYVMEPPPSAHASSANIFKGSWVTIYGECRKEELAHNVMLYPLSIKETQRPDDK